MEAPQRTRLLSRWFVLTAGLTALFWTVVWMIVGTVPVVRDIPMTEAWTIRLPFGISRWTDVLALPIFVTAILWTATHPWFREDDDRTEALVVGLVVGLGFGLVVGLVSGLVVGLGFGLVVGLITGLKFIFQKRTLDWLTGK